MLKKLKDIQLFLLERKVNTIGLLGGELGSLLFFYQYYVYSNEEKYLDLIQNQLNSIFSTPIDGQFSFCSGAAGLGWLINFFYKQNILEYNPNEIFSSVDPVLGEWMINEMEKGNYDFLHGASGVALYFISKLPDPNSVIYLNEFVEKLHYKSIIAKDGSTKWKSVLDIESQESGYNISLSHGISSIVNILCKLYQNNICKEVCIKLIEGAVKYIQNQKLPQEKYNSIFPCWALECTKKPFSSRLAWCYGDLGIGVTFWNASQVLKNVKLQNESIKLLLHSSKRKNLSNNSVHDAGICHGAAGISHIFKRMYYNTNIYEFYEAANYWINIAIRMAKYDDGYAGYKAWCPENKGGPKPVIGVLEGISGIGLVLLSNISNSEPTWDECFLLS